MATPTTNNITCHNCSISFLCLPMGLTKDEMHQLEQLTKKHLAVKRHEFLYQAGDTFRQLYAIQQGTFKSYTINLEGVEQINGFYLSAELLGFDGIRNGKHCVSMLALENSSVCQLPFDKLLVLAAKIPTLQYQLFNLMSQNVISSQLNLHINSPAEARFAAFLLNISRRLEERGLPARDFSLPMSREEIGNYLGLATETISRLFNSLEEKNVLTVNCRQVHLNNLRELQIMSCE